MAKEAKDGAGPLSKIPQPAKIAGGVVLLVCSVGLMLHRMPHRQYQQAHADKPRPKADAVAAAPAPKAAPAPAPAPVPVAAKAAPAPSKPGQAVVQVPPAAPAAPAVVVTDDEWLDACRPELGLLCHRMAARRARRCLGRYEDVLMSACREALGKRFPSSRSVATTGF